MGTFLSEDDLEAFVPDIDTAKASSMIEDAEALAALAAPCITDENFANGAAVKAIIRGAVLRWHEAGNGVVTSQTTGPFSVGLDTRVERRSMFWPSEIAQLRNLCTTGDQRAFMIDTTPVGSLTITHSLECSSLFGGDCSCGAELNSYYGGGPLW